MSPALNQDEVILVDSSDQVIGQLDKLAAHRHPAQLHRASSVWLWRRTDQGLIEVLLQQRSAQKIVGAGWWANGICGNVWPGESYQGCAERRLKVELGLTQLPRLVAGERFHYQAYCNSEYGEHELDQIFTAELPAGAAFQLNPAEVQAIQWVEAKQLKQAVAQAQVKSEHPVVSAAASVQPGLDTTKLAELTPALPIKLADGQSLVLAPWTVMMLELGILNWPRLVNQA
jgi:isopentenyl-diphosphate delta-isomerase